MLLFRLSPLAAQAPVKVLTLPEALQIASAHYQLLQAKENYAKASAEAVVSARKDGLPNVTVAVENAYGTLNGMNGLSSGEPGITTLTAGPATSAQNWNAAFGALYVSNINWNIYSFGLQRSHVAVARSQNNDDLADLRQEQFRLQVRVAGAYLDLLSAQRLRRSMEDNLLRASQLRDIILRRTENGLNPGVDSSTANAELSRAQLSLIDAQNFEQAKANQLSIQLGLTSQAFLLDSSFSVRLPGNMQDWLPVDPSPTASAAPAASTSPTASAPPAASAEPAASVQPAAPQTVRLSQNPILLYMASRVKTSNLVADYIKKTGLPRFSLFGVGQERGSGFGGNYATDPTEYSKGYFNGINPIRANYLIGVGLTWNITDLSRVRSKAASQHYVSDALGNEYNLQQNQLVNQLALADQQINNALAKYRQTPIQLRSAMDAYEQRSALYTNGLTTLVDVAQTLYMLNRAEIDRDVACNAVWQALLLKAGAMGNMDLFLQQL
jgi:outer membrane protein TolC